MERQAKTDSIYQPPNVPHCWHFVFLLRSNYFYQMNCSGKIKRDEGGHNYIQSSTGGYSGFNGQNKIDLTNLVGTQLPEQLNSKMI